MEESQLIDYKAFIGLLVKQVHNFRYIVIFSRLGLATGWFGPVNTGPRTRRRTCSEPVSLPIEPKLHVVVIKASLLLWLLTLGGVLGV